MNVKWPSFVRTKEKPQELKQKKGVFCIRTQVWFNLGAQDHQDSVDHFSLHFFGLYFLSPSWASSPTAPGLHPHPTKTSWKCCPLS